MARKLGEYGRDGGGKVYVFWCPGCETHHLYNVGVPNKPTWTFNGDFDKPTFTPSLLMFTRDDNGKEQTLCHLFVTDGKIVYCGDCVHGLNGQTVDLPDDPNPWGKDLRGVE